MIRSTAYALLPLALLVILAAAGSLFSYGVLLLAGDILPFAKLASKATQILLLLAIFPLKKSLNLSWPDLGFAAPKLFFKQLGQGMLLGFVTLLPVLLILVALDVHIWDDSRQWTFGKLAQKAGLALFLAFLIALGEETLFRGLLLSGLRRKFSVIAAAVLSSLYFAALHFFKSQTPVPYSELTLDRSVQLLVEAFGYCLNPVIFSAMAALFAVGLFLALLRSRAPQNIALCMGCHAAWVWQIKVSKDLFNVNLQAEHLDLVNLYYDGVVGPLVGGWLLLAIAGLLLWSNRSQRQA